MVDTFQPRRLSCFRIRKRRHENRMNQEKTKTPKPSQHDMGWKAQRTFSLLPVAGEIFLLTFPLYRTALLPKLVLASKFVGESPKQIKVRRDLWWTKTEVRRRILPWWYLR